LRLMQRVAPRCVTYPATTDTPSPTS
jgi:hypothetical protein